MFSSYGREKFVVGARDPSLARRTERENLTNKERIMHVSPREIKTLMANVRKMTPNKNGVTRNGETLARTAAFESNNQTF